jgi:hypothetical protein
MAACLVTISGTSGLLRLNYTISAVPYSIETGKGTLYIESTATAVTYTTLSGDVIATTASGCFTITAANAVCKLMLWKGITAPGYIANAVILGATTTIISDTIWPEGGRNLIDSINNASNDNVKVVGYRDGTLFDEYGNANYEFYYILRVIGSDVPTLRVKNADSTAYVYVPGLALANCTIPSDFEPITPCYSQLPTTTTTTAVPTTTTTTIVNVCEVYTVVVTSADLGAATGNTVTSNNNKVFVVYTDCNGILTTTSYVTAGLENSICVLSSTTPASYYYQNNIQISATTVITDAGTTCTIPAP